MTLLPSAAVRPEIPLALLLDTAEFGAELLSPSNADEDRLAAARRLRFALAIVVELEDPTPYLSPGDLLLITGLGLPRDPEGISAYVSRVKSSGIVGIVFGREPVYSEAPEALLDACREQEVPLIQLPPAIYFASIVSFVARALENERTRSLSAMLSTAQRLTETALQPHPVRRLLSLLARDCGGWAALRRGGETQLAGAFPEGLDLGALLSSLEQRLEPQLRQSGQPTAFTTATAQGADYEITAHFVRSRHQGTRSTDTPPILVLGKSPRITNSDRTVLLFTAYLVGIIDQVSVEQSNAVDQLLMHLLVDTAARTASGGDLSRVAGLLTAALGQGATAVHAVVATRAGDSAESASVSDAAWLRRLLRTPLVEHRGRRLRAFAARPPGTAELEQANAMGWWLGVSRAMGLSELPRAMGEAEELGRTAQRLGRHISGHDLDELGRIWPLAALDEPLLGEAAASLWLAPLDDEHAEERAALFAWLRQHGSWDRTARELGLHRNTVRRLVSAAGERLNRDLEDPVDRARTLLAFTMLEREG